MVEKRYRTARRESRWAVVLVTLSVVLLLGVLPDRISLAPLWITYLAGAVLIMPIAVAEANRAKPLWTFLEHTNTLLFCTFAAVMNTANLASMIHSILTGSPKVDGQQLLASSVAVWVINILIFSLLYWQMDRGGPGPRANNAETPPDWMFPQQNGQSETTQCDWRPIFVDYLFLGFSTATAFSTTDVLPWTSRAKILMMLQSTISLVTLAVVASRAINILGG